MADGEGVDLEIEIGVAALLEGVLRLQLAERRVESAIAATHGLTQSDILALALVVREAGMRIGRLAVELDITPGSASLLVSRLVTAGLVRRVRSAKDRRSVCLDATERGSAVSRSVREQYADAIRAAAATATAGCLTTAAGVLQSTAVHLGADEPVVSPLLRSVR